MKSRQTKKKDCKCDIHSFADFRRRFYPEPVVGCEEPEMPDPEEYGEKLAKESLRRLQAALVAR